MDRQYRGCISIEVFDYKPDPETIAREGLRHLREVEAPAWRRLTRGGFA